MRNVAEPGYCQGRREPAAGTHLIAGLDVAADRLTAKELHARAWPLGFTGFQAPDAAGDLQACAIADELGGFEASSRSRKSSRPASDRDWLLLASERCRCADRMRSWVRCTATRVVAAKGRRDDGGHIVDRACKEDRIGHRLTKPHHPWTKGQAERTNRTVKDATSKPFTIPDAMVAAMPGLRAEFALDLVIVNAENASHGFGLRRSGPTRCSPPASTC